MARPCAETNIGSCPGFAGAPFFAHVHIFDIKSESKRHNVWFCGRPQVVPTIQNTTYSSYLYHIIGLMWYTTKTKGKPMEIKDIHGNIVARKLDNRILDKGEKN